MIEPEIYLCIYCNEPIREEWLDGDNSLLVCEKKECLDNMSEDFENYLKNLPEK